MTTDQLGKRLDTVEVDVGQLKIEVARTTSAVEGMRADLGILFGKMDQVIMGNTNVNASRGMIAWQSVAWGIGLLVSLAGLALTLTTVGAGVILWAMNASDNRNAIRMDAITDNGKLRMEVVEAKLDHLRADVDRANAGTLVIDDKLSGVKAMVDKGVRPPLLLTP